MTYKYFIIVVSKLKKAVPRDTKLRTPVFEANALPLIPQHTVFLICLEFTYFTALHPYLEIDITTTLEALAKKFL